ncbi:MAG TPA: hypothetical protein VFL41_01360 [Gaiellaceae bacterium]|nr:hypothetical protein [Gaiellaceae bacterium]
MDEERGGARLRSFLFGGLVGASAVFAAARRVRRSRAKPVHAAGLSAFEEAPCYRETVDRENRATRAERERARR